MSRQHAQTIKVTISTGTDCNNFCILNNLKVFFKEIFFETMFGGRMDNEHVGSQFGYVNHLLKDSIMPRSIYLG